MSITKFPNWHKKNTQGIFFNYIKIKIYIILIYKVVSWLVRVGFRLYPNSTQFWQVVELRTCHQLQARSSRMELILTKTEVGRGEQDLIESQQNLDWSNPNLGKISSDLNRFETNREREEENGNFWRDFPFGLVSIGFQPLTHHSICSHQLLMSEICHHPPFCLDGVGSDQVAPGQRFH